MAAFERAAAETPRCTAMYSSMDGINYDCELPDGHEGEHRSTVRWPDEEPS